MRGIRIRSWCSSSFQQGWLSVGGTIQIKASKCVELLCKLCFSFGEQPLLVWFRFEEIAYAGLGKDVARAGRVWFQLAAQAADQPAHQALVSLTSVTPYIFHQVLGWHHSSRVGHQRVQQAKFQLGQPGGGTVAHLHATLGWIQGDARL